MDYSALKTRLREYYERSADERGDMDEYQYVNPSPALLLDEIARYGKHLSGRIADVGCGDGRICLLLDGPDRKMVGVDIAWKRCDRARRKFARTGRTAGFLQADAGCLPFQTRSLDGLVLTEVLEHVADPGEVLGEIRRVLKPGGRAILSVPTVSWRKFLLIKKNRTAVYETEEHLREYTYFDLTHFDQKFIRVRHLERSFQDNGLLILRCRGIGYDFCKLLYTIPGLERFDSLLYSRFLNRLWSRAPLINRLSIYRIYLLEKDNYGHSRPR